MDRRPLSIPFSAPDTWAGGFYELAIELGPRSDEHLIAAHGAIWDHPDMGGCYESTKIEPAHQPQLRPQGEGLIQSFYGIAHLPDANSFPAGTFLVRESDGGDGEILRTEDGSELRPDWLGLFIPVGALASVYPLGPWPFQGPPSEVGPPEGVDERSWREPLNRWFAELGKHIFRHAPFRLGLGFELSGQVYSTELTRTGIPANRYIDYLWPEQGSLMWYGANRWGDTGFSFVPSSP